MSRDAKSGLLYTTNTQKSTHFSVVCVEQTTTDRNSMCVVKRFEHWLHSPFLGSSIPKPSRIHHRCGCRGKDSGTRASKGPRGAKAGKAWTSEVINNFYLLSNDDWWWHIMAIEDRVLNSELVDQSSLNTPASFMRWRKSAWSQAASAAAATVVAGGTWCMEWCQECYGQNVWRPL